MPLDEIGELTPDELGHSAEDSFADLCGKARLSCNKSGRDRHGWDFIVDFPAVDPTAASAGVGLGGLAYQSLDQRARARSCHVQVKATLGASGDRVSLRLSSAEHLAKDPKPAFIVVPLMRRDGTVKAGYLIHLLDESLAKVLRRLRQEEAAKALDINHVKLSFDFRKQGERFSWTPKGLRDALTKAIGDDLSDYVVRKQEQLRSLGYDGPREELDATFTIDRSELADVFFGRKAIEVKSLQRFDKRFDIRLPLQAFDASHKVMLRLAPKAFDRCRVLVRGPHLTTPAAFDGEVVGVPPVVPLAEDQAKFLIRTDAFELTLTNRELRFDISLAADARRPPASWMRLLRALSHLATGEGAFVIHPMGAPMEPIEVPILTPIKGELLSYLPRLLKTLEDGDRLLARLDVEARDVTLDEVFDAGLDVHLAAGVLLQTPAHLQLDVTFERPANAPDRLPALYIDCVDYAGHALAYAATGVFAPSEDGQTWRLDPAVSVVDLSSTTDMEAYITEQSERFPDAECIFRPADANLLAGTASSGEVDG